MKGNGMAGSYSKAAYRPRPARPNDDPAPDILAREFNGYAPRTHLASDPAYVRVGSSWAYVCLPGDLASRQIAGHSVGVRHDCVCSIEVRPMQRNYSVRKSGRN
jgi:hypothetical protein